MWAGSVLLMIINVIKLPWPIFGTVQALDPLPYIIVFLFVFLLFFLNLFNVAQQLKYKNVERRSK